MTVDKLVYYNDLHKVYVRRSDQICNYRITIEPRNPAGCSKALAIQMTDDEDPSFLFNLLLTQDDYAVLKSKQGLHADFESFPKQLARLLTDSKKAPQLMLTLDDSDADFCTVQSGLFFKIVEKNDFKNLCHLSLRMTPGSDSDIKHHMAGKLKILQNQFVEERSRCIRLEEQLDETQRNLALTRNELESFKLKMTEECSLAKVAASREITAEKERLVQFEKDLLAQKEADRIRLESEYRVELRQLQDRITLLTHSNANLFEAKNEAENILKEKNVELENRQSELLKLQNEVEQMQARLTTAERCARVAEDSNGVTERLRKEMASAQTHAARCEAALRERDANLQRLKANVHHMSQEGVKKNRMIAVLKEELNAKRNKASLMVQIGEKLEQEIEKLKAKLKDFEKELETERRKNLELSKMQEQINDLQKKFDDADATVKRQDGVINYLNRKLTEANIPQAPQTIAEKKTTDDSDLKFWPPWLSSFIDKGPPSVVDSAVSLSPTLNPAESSRSYADPSYMVPGEIKKPPTKPTLKAKHSAYFPPKS